MDMIKKKGYAYIFIAGLIWGTVGIFLKEMGRYGASAIEIGFLRMTFAFLTMFLIIVVKEGVHGMRIGKKELFCCLLLGIVCHGIHNIFYSLAVTYSGVSISAVVINIAPAVTLVTAFFVFHERMTLIKIAAIAINILGCTLAVTGGDFSFGKVSVIGILCSVGAGVTYGMVGIFGKFAMKKTSALVISAYSYLFAAVMLFVPAKPWSFEMSGDFVHVIVLAAVLAVVPTSFGYLLYYRGLAMIGDTSNATVIASNQTVVAAILGMVIYGEELNAICWIGIVIVILSIILMNMKTRPSVLRMDWQNASVWYIMGRKKNIMRGRSYEKF